jgi:hypothetical protein
LQADLDGDGRKEQIVLDGSREPTLSVRRAGKRLWEGVPGRWRPWKLLLADVDGDGKREIVVGVRKTTRFFPRPHNCLFVYRFDGRTVRPKWLGSSLSRPFVDFAFANLDGDAADELVSVEIPRDGKRCVAVYSWNGFGFSMDRQQGPWRSVRLAQVGRNRVVLEADSGRVLLRKGR